MDNHLFPFIPPSLQLVEFLLFVFHVQQSSSVDMEVTLRTTEGFVDDKEKHNVAMMDDAGMQQPANL